MKIIILNQLKYCYIFFLAKNHSKELKNVKYNRIKYIINVIVICVVYAINAYYHFLFSLCSYFSPDIFINCVIYEQSF